MAANLPPDDLEFVQKKKAAEDLEFAAKNAAQDARMRLANETDEDYAARMKLEQEADAAKKENEKKMGTTSPQTPPKGSGEIGKHSWYYIGTLFGKFLSNLAQEVGNSIKENGGGLKGAGITLAKGIWYAGKLATNIVTLGAFSKSLKGEEGDIAHNANPENAGPQGQVDRNRAAKAGRDYGNQAIAGPAVVGNEGGPIAHAKDMAEAEAPGLEREAAPAPDAAEPEPAADNEQEEEHGPQQGPGH